MLLCLLFILFFPSTAENDHKRLSLLALLPRCCSLFVSGGGTQSTENLYWFFLKHLFTWQKSLPYLQTPVLTFNIQLLLSLITTLYPSHPDKDDLILIFLMLWRMEAGSTTTQSAEKKTDRSPVRPVQSHSLPPRNLAGE